MLTRRKVSDGSKAKKALLCIKEAESVLKTKDKKNKFERQRKTWMDEKSIP